MNIDTGRLVQLQPGEAPPPGAQMVPPELLVAARRKLNGQKEATVSLTSGGRLALWASEQRSKRAKKKQKARKRDHARRVDRKKHAVKQSRAQNRS